MTLHQLETVALPRRFSLPMQEIWLLQSRFASRQRKRVMRLLAHPRFRAAYDFLLLRLTASSEHAEDVAFWRKAQTQSGDELSASLGVVPPRHVEAAEARAEGNEAHAGESASAAPKRRRRRRRPGGAAPVAE